MTKEIKIDAITGYPQYTKEDVKALIKENEIEMIRLEFTDLHGITRGKFLPADMIDTVFHGISLCSAVLALGFDNTVAEIEGLFENNYDDMTVIADPTTFVILPHVEKTALIIGDLFYDGKPMAISPRGFLKKMIAEYQALGLNPITASELEFFVFKKQPDGSLKQYTNELCNCYTANSRMDPDGYLFSLTRTFKKMGFKILYMNHEFYPGQYEYNWSHSPALRDADETSIFKSISKDIAEQNNLLVTFMAKPKNDNGGSGCHFHISLGDMATGKDIFDDPNGELGFSDTLRHFVGGVLKHSRGITAFLSPTINCYKRYVPDSFAPCFIGWGKDNRTTFVRIPDERGQATRVEVRAGSAASNPYLALGGVLAAGLDGIKNKIEPPEIITTDLYHDKKKQTDFVPRSLFRALEELKADSWLNECAGEQLVNAFIALKQLEVETYTNMVTEWEWKNYSYHI